MTAEVKLTACDKQTELLSAEFAVPQQWVAFARRVAGVPNTDPRLLGVDPLTSEQVAQIAQTASLSLDPAKYDYCLESLATARKSHASAA